MTLRQINVFNALAILIVKIILLQYVQPQTLALLVLKMLNATLHWYVYHRIVSNAKPIWSALVQLQFAIIAPIHALFAIPTQSVPRIHQANSAILPFIIAYNVLITLSVLAKPRYAPL